ncbi:DUF58 domain-containing protein [Paenibacillus chartarius]|uniref:DUF58 domain-containing protein n=1 Tax=Paenibacillus chartarius TaxID=747481 RepID=A0ABV6DVW5_9BACL
MELHMLFLITLGTIAVLALLYRRQALRDVTYEREFSTGSAYEGDSIEMIERIGNRKLLPLPWLRLESLLSGRLVFERQASLDIRSGDILQNHISLFSLRPYKLITRRHRVRCAARGWYRLESATMTAGDPFGLMNVSKRCPLSLQLLVYPKPLPMSELPLPSHSWLGDITVRRWMMEDPFLTTGTREYRPGDSFRSVNWKATARTGELQVHKRDYTADHRLWIVLNVEVSESMWKQVTDPPRIERAIRYAASVAHYALGVGVNTGFLSNGWVADCTLKWPVREEPGGGTEQLKTLLDSMAKLELESVMSFPELLRCELDAGTQGADFLLITCHTDGGMDLVIDELRRRGNGVEIMYVPGGEGTRDAASS